MYSKYPLLYYIAWYEKSGNQYIVDDYELKGINLNVLQKIFNIDPQDPDPINREMAYSYEIREEQAKELVTFVSFKFDFSKYDYYLEGRGDY